MACRLKAHFILGYDSSLINQLLEFRKKLFVDELGWQLNVIDGKECDQFDSNDSVYCVLYDSEEIIGCFRAIRCDRPYLVRSVFPHLAQSQSYPRSSDYWEISRFGLTKSHRHYSALLYGLMLQFAISENATALVALVDLQHEERLQKIGLVTQRYGRSQLVGWHRDGSEIFGVAGEIPIARQVPEILTMLIAETNQVEIDNEVYAGLKSLSA